VTNSGYVVQPASPSDNAQNVTIAQDGTVTASMPARPRREHRPDPASLANPSASTRGQNLFAETALRQPRPAPAATAWARCSKATKPARTWWRNCDDPTQRAYEMNSRRSDSDQMLQKLAQI
jgi:flagellar basal body rod protein FlgG